MENVSRAPSLSKGAVFALLVVYLFAQIFYHAVIGLKFDTSTLGVSWQYLDPQLLKSHLGESLLYLHSQPPLFNLYLGIGLKLGSFSYYFFLICYQILGLILIFSIFWLMRQLGVAERIALVLSSAFVFSPSFLLYQDLLFYAFPTTTLMTLSAVLLLRFLRDKTEISGQLFFLCGFVLCGTWTLFHLAYFVTVLIVLLLKRDLPRKTVFRCALVPLILLIALYAKNAILFGQFTATTWTGMNLAIGIQRSVSPEELHTLIANGKLSPVSTVTPFSPLTDYPVALRHEHTQGPLAISEPFKTNGEPNFNNSAYIAIAHDYGRDCVFLLRHHPQYYLHSLKDSLRLYFFSSSHYKQLHNAYSKKLNPLIFFSDRVVYGCFHDGVGLFLLIVLPLITVYGLYHAIRVKDTKSLTQEQRALLLFLGLNIIYVALISTMLNMVEVQRMRFTTDPLSLVLLGFFLQRVLLGRFQQVGPRHTSMEMAISDKDLVLEKP